MLPWALRKKVAPAPGLGRLLGAVIAARGISDPNSLLNPKEDGLPRNTEKAAALLKSADKVLVAGDYDCDGLSGSAILLRGLWTLHKRVEHYVPSRSRGYGFHKEAVDQAVLNNCDVIIAVDCGVTAQETINYAVSKGLKVIVADHHPFDNAPENCILVHPGGHENPSLCGAGVAYKITQAMGLPEYPFAQLAAIATLADAVQLTEGNRALIRKGLSQEPIPGIRALLELTSSKLDPETVCFQIAPRINAASRMGNPEVGLYLLMTSDPEMAIRTAEKLNSLNEERKAAVADALESCGEDSVVMLDAPVGVVGIIAGRLSENLGVPSVVLTSTGKGSARAPEGHSLIEMLAKCPSVSRFGGHAPAAGLEIDPELFSSFREEFLRSVKARPAFLTIDVALDFMPTQAEVAEMQSIGPFGNGNPEPLFIFRGDASVKKYEKCSHINIGTMKGVIFKDASWFDGKKVAAIGSLHVSDYNGDVEAIVRDMRIDVHVDREFLLQAYRMGEDVPNKPPYLLAQRIFREIAPGVGGKKNLFDSMTYRRYGLEMCN
jgi:single-stranded-DNA-specific exonuclease